MSLRVKITKLPKLHAKKRHLAAEIRIWLAAYLPARRASRADPLAALRTD